MNSGFWNTTSTELTGTTTGTFQDLATTFDYFYKALGADYGYAPSQPPDPRSSNERWLDDELNRVRKLAG